MAAPGSAAKEAVETSKAAHLHASHRLSIALLHHIATTAVATHGTVTHLVVAALEALLGTTTHFSTQADVMLLLIKE